VGARVSVFADIGAIAPQQIWDGVVARAVHGERLTMGLIDLAPNSLVPEHSHANEQVGILVRGSFRFRVGDETREVEPGGTWRILADVPHEVETGSEGALVIEIWSPPREDWKELERQEPRSPHWPE
jgi:quercetin dioxygenase-like cupin family protein